MAVQQKKPPLSSNRNPKSRPLRKPEQRHAQEREALMQAMSALISQATGGDASESVRRYGSPMDAYNMGARGNSGMMAVPDDRRPSIGGGAGRREPNAGIQGAMGLLQGLSAENQTKQLQQRRAQQEAEAAQLQQSLPPLQIGQQSAPPAPMAGPAPAAQPPQWQPQRADVSQSGWGPQAGSGPAPAAMSAGGPGWGTDQDPQMMAMRNLLAQLRQTRQATQAAQPATDPYAAQRWQDPQELVDLRAAAPRDTARLQAGGPTYADPLETQPFTGYQQGFGDQGLQPDVNADLESQIAQYRATQGSSNPLGARDAISRQHAINRGMPARPEVQPKNLGRKQIMLGGAQSALPGATRSPAQTFYEDEMPQGMDMAIRQRKQQALGEQRTRMQTAAQNPTVAQQERKAEMERRRQNVMMRAAGLDPIQAMAFGQGGMGGQGGGMDFNRMAALYGPEVAMRMELGRMEAESEGGGRDIDRRKVENDERTNRMLLMAQLRQMGLDEQGNPLPVQGQQDIQRGILTPEAETEMENAFAGQDIYRGGWDPWFGAGESIGRFFGADMNVGNQRRRQILLDSGFPPELVDEFMRRSYNHAP